MWWIWLIAAVALLIILTLIICSFTAKYMLHPKNPRGEAAMQSETDFWGFDRAVFDSYDKEKISIKSQYGYTLGGRYIKSDCPKKDGIRRVAVICHGFTSSLFGSVKYARIYLSLGFDCVIYDHRNHGDNERNFTSMGWYEKDDLKTVCDFVRDRFKGERLIIGTHGESMGAATVMLESGEDDNLDFVVEDCGYSTLEEQVDCSIKALFHLPKYPFVPISSRLIRLKYGFKMSDVRPIDGVARSKMPMLFIHGENDKFVPYYMLKENYNAKKIGYKEMISVKGAAHAESVKVDFNAYYNYIESFLKKIGAL